MYYEQLSCNATTTTTRPMDSDRRSRETQRTEKDIRERLQGQWSFELFSAGSTSSLALNSQESQPTMAGRRAIASEVQSPTGSVGGWTALTPLIQGGCLAIRHRVNRGPSDRPTASYPGVHHPPEGHPSSQHDSLQALQGPKADRRCA
jgi:hypothetical protein